MSYTALAGPIVVIATLMLIQLLTADVIGIRAKHTPGTPVTSSHDDILFRATRALANTNESIAILLLLLVAGILSGADAGLMTSAAWAYVAGRALHMAFYYANLQILRSVAFVLVLLSLIALWVIAIWF